MNEDELWCDIEASSTFETFVAETAKFGCMPLVVPVPAQPRSRFETSVPRTETKALYMCHSRPRKRAGD